MDIKAYRESGILERFALGTASEKEMAEVRCLSGIYPEIREELMSIEESLESYALAHTQATTPELKGKIWKKLKIYTLIKPRVKILRFAKFLLRDPFPRLG